MKQWIGETFLKFVGWEAVGDAPSEPAFVAIAAPHTSNWDLPYSLACAWARGVDPKWMGKHTLFEGPLGGLLRAIGGIPVVRHERRNMVDQMADLLREGKPLALMVPAEGTRSKHDYWKSGFYRIAQAADVPVVLAFLDYEGKRGGLGPALRMTGDVKADMDRIRAFYADKAPLFPENYTEPRLRDEEAGAE